jgi:hypothetical protein
MAPEGKQIISE